MRLQVSASVSARKCKRRGRQPEDVRKLNGSCDQDPCSLQLERRQGRWSGRFQAQDRCAQMTL